MPTAEKSITTNPARALYENYMTGEYGKKWDDLPAGVQKRWADALAAGVIAMTSVRIDPVEDFDTEAFHAASLQPGTIAVLPEPTESIFSDGEPYAAMTVDYLGCEYLSRDVENIEKIAAAGSNCPTEVVYLFRGTRQAQDVAPLQNVRSEVTHEDICDTHEGGTCNCDWSAADEGNPHPDDIAVDRFAIAMKTKLSKKRDEGRGGWEDKDDCSHIFLSQLLREHVEKGDPVDVGNFAMMLHQRGERITSLLETLQGE